MKIVYISYLPQLTQILKTHDKVILDFLTEQCGPCKQLDIVLRQVENLKAETDNEVVVCKIDVENDEFLKLSTKYEVRFLPTMVYLLKNKVVHKTTGSMDREKFSELLDTVFL